MANRPSKPKHADSTNSTLVLLGVLTTIVVVAFIGRAFDIEPIMQAFKVLAIIL